jgi:hypothetical protein
MAAVGILNELKEKHGLLEDKAAKRKEEKKSKKEEKAAAPKKEEKAPAAKAPEVKSVAPAPVSEPKKSENAAPKSEKKTTVKKVDLFSPEGTKQLESYLSFHPYISSFTPTAEDQAVYKALKSKGAKLDGSAGRWLKHIAAFSDEEQQEWPVTVEQLKGTGVDVRGSALFNY